ncbi:dynamin family protein [Niallia hominis]|uniref:Dynamin family protein n=1 Tax=Niallia hominis TaxID=3133173 RepID=A0ABV1ESU6_9BACI
MECKTCGKSLSSTDLLCSSCNTLNEFYVFKNSELQAQFTSKLNDLNKVIENVLPSVEYAWDESVSLYASTIEKAKAILKTDIIKDQVATKTFKDMDNLLQRCKSAEFHIALVGAIKAGKSTLINALLGYDLASTRVTPETASLTKFRSSKENNFVKVSFYTSDEWQRLWNSAKDSRAKVFLEEYAKLDAEKIKNDWLNQDSITVQCESIEALKEEIHKWSSSKTATHYFVKEVEVGLVDFDMPEGVVFVDTPGLDDVVAYRSDITRDYINRANAVLVCVKSDSLTGPEMATIYSVFANTRYNPEKVYIIATQLDTLNRPEENWKEQRVEWLKYITDEGAYGDPQLASRNLIPVSGYLYSLIKKYDAIEEGSDEYFELASILMKFRIMPQNVGEHAQRLLDFTGVDSLKRQIEKEVINNHKVLLIQDIRETYLLCKEDIRELTSKMKQGQLEVIEYSEKNIHEIQKRKAEREQELVEIETDKKELETLLTLVKQTTSSRVKELTEAIKGMAVQ